MLTISGVQLSVRGPKFFRALDKQAREFAGVQRTGPEPNWRALRGQLLNGDLNNATFVASWLESAGYVARVGKFDPLAPDGAADEMKWLPDYVSSEITLWLRHRRDVVQWLMEIPQERLRAAIGIASGFHGRIVLEAAQRKKLIRDLKAPDNLDARTLYDFLTGAGVAPALHAVFSWGARGRPSITVETDTPMEAIALSTHIDRNFSARQWTTCVRCGTGFEGDRETGKYCSSRCRNYVITNARRKKVRLFTAAERAWRALSPKDRRGVDPVEWITKHARRKDTAITSEWVRQELAKLKSKSGGK